MLVTKRRRRGQDIDGVLVLDKPSGLTSNESLQRVKRLFDARKVGHTGSLDTLATGVLPLCFGEATKFSRFLLNADKSYHVHSILGIATNTGDADGEVVQRSETSHIQREDLENSLVGFRGSFDQIPPMFSAIKRNGQPLYKLARKGVEVPRQARPVTVNKNTLTHFENPHFQLDIQCSKGTYIRTIVDDIGKNLGVGAHVTALRRHSVGTFDETKLVTLEELESAKEQGTLKSLLLPISSVVEEWPAIFVAGPTAYNVRHGQPIRVRQTPAEGWVKLCETVGDSRVRFLGIGEVLDDGRVAPRRLLA